MKNINFLYSTNRFKTYYQGRFKELLEKYNLAQIDADILLFLNNNKEYNTATDICTMRWLAKSNVSNSLTSLEQKGYIRVLQDKDNKKIKRIYIENGEDEMIRELVAVQERALDTLVKGFSEEEIETAKKILNHINRNIKEETER